MEEFKVMRKEHSDIDFLFFTNKVFKLIEIIAQSFKRNMAFTKKCLPCLGLIHTHTNTLHTNIIMCVHE